MPSKTVSWVILILLFCTLVAVFCVKSAKAQSITIYIAPDGSINPSTAPISSIDNVTYALTGNISYPIYDGIAVEKSNITVDGNGYVVLGNSPAAGSEGNGRGIDLSFASNVTIKNCQIENFFTGVYLSYSSNEVISGNKIIANTWEGISLQSSSNNAISGNTITNNANTGIGLYYSSNYNNTICENNIGNNPHGIFLDKSSNSSVSNNTIAYNQIGLWLAESSDNTIYNNNFIDNKEQVSKDVFSIDAWDNGYPSGGNYWSDYNGTDANHDGIGDTPCTIDSNSTDNYPLMSPFTNWHLVGDLNGDGKVNQTDLVLLTNAYGSKVGDPNWNPLADMAPPYGIIGLTDLVTMALHYGQYNP